MNPTDLAQFASTAFPPNRAETDPSKKTPAWIRQMAAAGVTEFMRCKAQWQLWAHDPNIADNIRYAQGTQDTAQYKRFAGSSDTLNANSIQVTNRDGHFEEEGNADSYVSRRGSGGGVGDPLGLDSIIKAQPLPVLPVKLQALKALIVQRYETNITALGQKAKKERAEHEAELRLWMDLGPDLKSQGVPPPPGMPDPMPQTEPELQTYLSTWQVGAAAELELKILIADVESDIEQLMDEVADDLLTHGYGGLCDHYEPGKRTVTKRILPGRGLFLPSAYPDYRDADMGGVFETINLDTLLAEASNNRRTCNAEGKNWTKEDRGRLAELAAKSLPKNMLDNGDPDQMTGTGAITVIRWRFRTDDLRAEESYRDADGRPRTKKAKADQEKPDNEGGTLSKVPVNHLYEATLICGTDLAYGCGKVKDQGRDLQNPLKARLPFSLFSAGVSGGKPVSIVQRVKGIVDEMERSYRAYMAVKRTYTPEGANYPPDMLTKMAKAMKIGGENPEMAAYEYIKLSGDSFFPRVDEDNPAVSPSNNPITANPFGVPPAALAHMADVFQQYQLLESLTGANAVVSAATPGAEAGKGVNQLALQGAANIMGFARTGLRKVYEGHAKNLAGRIRATDATIPTTGNVPGPDGNMREVGPRQDFHEYAFHMRVELGPTDAEWNDLYQRAAQASANGQITVDDEMQLKWLRNLKTAQRYLAMAVRRKARQDQQDEIGKLKANADSQTQTAQATAQAQQQTDALASQLRMTELAFARETAWGTVERQTQAQLQVAQGNNATKLAIAQDDQAGAAQREAAADLRRQEHDHTSTLLNHALAPEPVAA